MGSQAATTQPPPIAVVSKTIELKKPVLDETPTDAVADFPDDELPKRPPYVLLLVAVCLLIVGWVVVQALGSSAQPTPVAAQAGPPPPPAAAAVESEPTTLVRDVPKPLLVANGPNTTPQRAQTTDSSPAAVPQSTGIHQEIPDVPARARRTIRGHVKVTVRLIVDKEGAVFAALVDDPGPSRYFEKVALEAAKKWTFPAVTTEDSRLELVQFDFTSQGTTGEAVAVQ
jgi:TonB family protein